MFGEHTDISLGNAAARQKVNKQFCLYGKKIPRLGRNVKGLRSFTLERCVWGDTQFITANMHNC